MSSICIVEDDQDIADIIGHYLRREGHQIRKFSSGEHAISEVESKVDFKPDLYIVDWMLPGLSGIEVIKTLRFRKNISTPILMLTARGTAGDVVMGLESGADDYVQKPFEFPVLMARVRALLRRAGSVGATGVELDLAEGGVNPGKKELKFSGTIQCGGIKVDADRHEVTCNGEGVELTPSEFKLLWSLVSNHGRVLTRDRLIELVQGSGIAVIDRAIDTHVFGLRKKLGACANIVQTVRGVGYRVLDESK